MAAPSAIMDRYVLEGRLGAGGMSTVFLATDSVLERPVAIKLLAEHLAEDEDFVARFRREALAVARLQHPNIVQVFDSGEDADSGRHFIVMEYVDGPSCADMLREHKQLEIEQTVHIVRDACHGLDYAHRAGVVHRDVKPGNLLIAQEMNITKLADFGIAKAAEQTRITQAGSVLGTAAYLSPEQAHGEESGPPSDIYSLGVCAYQFLTGRLPHEYASLTELALKQQRDAVQPIAEFRPEVPAELDEAIRLCLEREPGNRYRSALEMAEALDAGLHGQMTEATRRMALSDTEATRAMDASEAMDATSATRAMPRTAYAPAAPAPAPAYAETAAPDVRRDRREAVRAARRRRMATFFALLLVVAAIAAVGLAILATSDRGGSGVSPIEEGDVEGQIQELRNLIEENTR